MTLPEVVLSGTALFWFSCAFAALYQTRKAIRMAQELAKENAEMRRLLYEQREEIERLRV